VETLSELFNGGIVTARHPALLQPGELQRADDCVMRTNDPALWRAPGRAKVNTAALGSVWAGAAEGVKGLAHLSFERNRFNQLLAYSGTVLSRACLSASSTGTLDPIDLALSCTTNSTVTVTSAALFGQVQAGWVVTGTNIAPGTTVDSVTNASTLVLSRKASGSGTQTLTFNPMIELGGPSQVAGTVSGTTTFTATTGFPFTQAILGARVWTSTWTFTRVIDVSGQSGTTGHYNIVTLADAQSNGAATFFFQYGTVQAFANNGTTDEMLDNAQYGGSYFVWLGRGPMQRIYWQQRPSVTVAAENVRLDDALICRPSGLNPVVAQPTVVATANAAFNWPVTLPAGYYWFLCTEIYDPNNDSTNEVESSYLGGTKPLVAKAEPVAVNLPAVTGYGITVTFPAVLNTGTDGRFATHWGLYMYGPTNDAKAIPSLAAFRRIAKPQINAASGQTYVVHEDRVIQAKAPTTAAASGTFTRWTNDSTGPMVRGGSGATGYARAASGSYNNVGSPAYAPAESILGTFGFSTGAPYNGYTVTGIRVIVRGKASTDGNAGKVAGYYIQVISGSQKTDKIWGDFGTNWTETWFGGEADTMGVAWVTGDLTNITVLLGKTGTGSPQLCFIDYIELDVFFQSSSINLNGPPFRVVTYRDQVGDTISEPANGVAPDCNTGDMFQGSLVVNDLSDETAIRFSLPGNPEAFPKPYVMRFNTTKRKDRATYVRTLGQVLVVGLENGIRCVRYLPTEQDTDFREGIAHDPIASDHGIPGPLAAVQFDWPGRGTMIAYASVAGPMVTDGLKTEPLNTDLDWANTVNFAALSSAVFRVYPKEKWLVLYYCPAGATHTKNTRALIFHYGSDHVKPGGELPCTGPLTVSGRASTEVMLSGFPFLFTGHETNGFIYQEDNGVAQASGYQVHNAAGTLANAPIIPFVRQRRWYPCGITHECHLYKAYLLFSTYGATTTVTNCTVTAGSATVASSAAFGSIVAGMRVKGTGIDEGTIVLTASASSITLSRVANTDATGLTTTTLTFDTGTISVTNRGLSIGEAAAGMTQQWGSNLIGDMIVVHIDAARAGLELQIEKVPLTFTTDADGYRFDSATWADLSVNMRLHQCMLQYDDLGPESTRSVA